MIFALEDSSVEAWFQWFQETRYVRCRAFLCATYGLEPLDAEALMNTAYLQVVVHWNTLQTPLAYFWTTLRREVHKHLHDLTRERQHRDAYARQQRFHTLTAASTDRQVADLLALATPRQRQLLGWFVQGYADAQAAAQLGTTAHAIRQARYETYIDLRKRSTL